MPRNIEVEIVHGIKIDADFSDLTFRATYWQGGRFEHPTPWQLLKWLEKEDPNSTFFDIGANYGFFSYFILSRIPDCSVYSFEPNLQNFTRQLITKERNQLKTFHPFNMGLSDHDGDLILHHGIEDLGHSTFAEHPGLTQSAISSVHVLPFDVWLDNVKPPIKNPKGWVAKIDVEGYELKVLNGMARSLARLCFRGLVVEINPFTLNLTGAKNLDIFNFMNKHDYRATNVSPSMERSFVGNAFFEIK